MKLPKELREKQEIKGAAKKAKNCSVKGCNKAAIRSLAEDKYTSYAELANLKLEENRLHKIYLCKEHYNALSKEKKSQEKLYQKKGFLDDSRASKIGKHYDID